MSNLNPKKKRKNMPKVMVRSQMAKVKMKLPKTVINPRKKLAWRR
jgi:hypothetical protein